LIYLIAGDVERSLEDGFRNFRAWDEGKDPFGIPSLGKELRTAEKKMANSGLVEMQTV
jgi:hypothetical protein